MLQEVVFVDDPVDEDAASVRDGVVIECSTLLTLEVEGVADMMSGTPAVDLDDRRADDAQCFDWSKFPEEILYRKCEYGKWSEIIQGTFFPNQVCQDEKGY